MKAKFRIGILFDDYNIPAWAYKMLEIINSSPSSEIVLILRQKPEKVEQKNFLNRISEYSRDGLFSLWCIIDRKLNKCSPDAFETRNIEKLFSAATIEVDPQHTNITDPIYGHEFEEIKKYNLDIIIKIGTGIPGDDILKLSRYGMWSFYHPEHDLNNGDMAGVWEVLDNRDETEIIWQIQAENQDDLILLNKSIFSTDKNSIYRNKNKYYWIASSLIPMKIQELYDIGEEVFFKQIKLLNEHPRFYSKKQHTTPGYTEMLIFCPKLIIKKISNKTRDLFYFDQWIILFKLNSSNIISTSLSQFKKIIPPKDRFWADPHIIKRNGKYYIFMEELIYAKNKGYICVIEMDDHGNYTAPVKVLEKDYHLSYPFLTENNGNLYMIPETKQNNTIELYKCTDFPYKWELEIVLMNNIKAVDSTIIFRDNKYWLFCDVTRSKGPSAPDEIFLFYSDNLISDNWISHPQNPIISDKKRSRSAGNFFTYKDKLYRPSQNGFKHYGHSMKINHVIELTENTYKEKVVDSISPDWEDGILSTHTINSVDKLTVIDALIRRRK